MVCNTCFTDSTNTLLAWAIYCYYMIPKSDVLPVFYHYRPLAPHLAHSIREITSMSTPISK
jgi:hypothetical protein